jgi:hypothetical protein
MCQSLVTFLPADSCFSDISAGIIIISSNVTCYRHHIARNWSFGVKQQSLTLQDTIKKSTYFICDQTLCLYILALSNNNTHNFPVLVTLIFKKGRRGRDRMVVGFTTIYVIGHITTDFVGSTPIQG